jgi:hypothetical protein
VLDGKLYVYGGVHMTSAAATNCIHEDEDIWSWDGRGGWQRYVSPQRGVLGLVLPSTWIATTGAPPGKRCCAAMFTNGKRIMIVGGLERNGWEDVATERERPWEYIHILLPCNLWVRLRVSGGLPNMECIGVMTDDGTSSDVFILGK